MLVAVAQIVARLARDNKRAVNYTDRHGAPTVARRPPFGVKTRQQEPVIHDGLIATTSKIRPNVVAEQGALYLNLLAATQRNVLTKTGRFRVVATAQRKHDGQRRPRRSPSRDGGSERLQLHSKLQKAMSSHAPQTLPAQQRTLKRTFAKDCSCRPPTLVTKPRDTPCSQSGVRRQCGHTKRAQSRSPRCPNQKSP